MKQRKAFCLCLVLCVALATLTGCRDDRKIKSNEFSKINAVCELATLKCYYHNVAEYEQEAWDILKNLGNMGYKKIWIEYSGIVEIGVNVTKVRISPADDRGIVNVYIPEAEILNVDFDMDSITDPITETGLLTSVSADEKTKAFGVAQESMKEAAAEDESLLLQAKDRAKKIIEGYVKNVGEEIGKEYTVEWVEE